MSTFTQQNFRVSITTPLGKDKLLFKSLQGEEHISQLFLFHVETLSESKTLNFQQVVGKSITITFNYGKSEKRYFNGIATRFIQAGSDSSDARFTTYRIEVRPWLWMLTLTRNCRIFQNLSVPDIIKKIFSDLGFSDYRSALTGSYQPRVYCVQYEETAFDFVSRLMEDEGIFYFFEHANEKHTLVLADDLDAHKSCPDVSTANFWQVTNSAPPNDVIVHCTLSEQVTTGKYAVDDFNFETPATDLLTQVKGKSGDMQVYEYAAGYTKSDEGEKIAKRRIESLECASKLLEGQGHCASFTSGYKFTLAKHPRQDMNASYVLQWVSHSLSLTRYTNSFKAFPATVSFRPPITTPKPRIVGTQTAIVTGKSGEEIWTDKYGRIKVQFHWDQEGKKDENTSCWIRVNQHWAGKTWGSIWIPRIGQEVIISFLEGNPDLPIVTGAVYNAQQTVPYTLPGEQTKSTIKSNSSKGGEGSNEIRFEDKKDNEEVYLHAQKDLVVKVENNQTNTIKKNRTTTIEEENETLTVTKGKRTTTIKQNDELTVQDGDRTITIAAGQETHTIKKDYTIKVDGNLVIEVNGSITIKSKTSSMTMQASTSIDVKAGTALTSKAGTTLTNEATTSLKNKGLDITNEASTTLTNKGVQITHDASAMLTSKAGAVQKIEGGAMVEIKGALVKIN